MLPERFQFSQSNLQNYDDCPRRFELRYIEQLKWPAAEAEPIAERERHLRLGQDIHHIIHQHLIGLPETAITNAIQEGELIEWWNNYLHSFYNPHHPDTLIPPQHYPEITLSTSLAGYRLIAKLDLLAIQPGERALIIDWKSSQRRPSHSSLKKRWQTLVYPYVLVEAGKEFNKGIPIEPEQIEMVYWFTAAPDEPEHFKYDSQQHEVNRQTLTDLITEIANRRQFDLTTETRRCRFCAYRSLCERGIHAGDVNEMDAEIDELDTLDFSFDFDQIAEVEF